MAAPDTKTAVEREVHVAAPPDVVFDYFTQPELLVRWQAESVDVDVRPGGGMRMDLGNEHVALGEYVAVERPHRVAFTWGWEGNDGVPPGSSLVEITFEPDGDGTVVRLRHSGLPDENAATQHGTGWAHYLARVAIAATGADPGPNTFGTSG